MHIKILRLTNTLRFWKHLRITYCPFPATHWNGFDQFLIFFKNSDFSKNCYTHLIAYKSSQVDNLWGAKQPSLEEKMELAPHREQMAKLQ